MLAIASYVPWTRKHWKDQVLAIESYVPWTRKHWKDQVLAIESYVPWTRKHWKDQVLAIESYVPWTRKHWMEDAISGKIPQWAILTNTAAGNFIEKNCHLLWKISNGKGIRELRNCYLLPFTKKNLLLILIKENLRKQMRKSSLPKLDKSAPEIKCGSQVCLNWINLHRPSKSNCKKKTLPGEVSLRTNCQSIQWGNYWKKIHVGIGDRSWKIWAEILVSIRWHCKHPSL